jgi:hypothetical protein
MEHNPEAVCGENDQRQAGNSRPEAVTISGLTRAVDAVDYIPVDLTGRRPLTRQAQSGGHHGAGPFIQPLVTVPGFGECHPAHTGGSDHPWTKVGMSSASSS